MDKNIELEKFKLQDNQYSFPYHYLPNIENGMFHFGRDLAQGVGYLSYMKTYAEYINSYSPKKYIDVGCGDGRMFSLLDPQIQMYGCDLSEKAVKSANAFAPFAKIYCKGVEDMPKEEFDVVSCIEVIEHIPDDMINSFISALFSVCKKGGHIIISVPTINLHPMPSKHYRHYTSELLKSQIDQTLNDYEIVEEQYFMKYDNWYKFLVRLCCNKYIRLRFLDQYIWNYCWEKLRFADSKSGIHLFWVLRKI